MVLDFPAPRYKIVNQNGRLELVAKSGTQEKPIYVDFASPILKHRRAHGGREAIFRAIAGTGPRPNLVLDLTAGLGKDAYVLASKGLDVLMLERCQVIYHLLRDGINRGLGDENISAVVKRMKLIAQDALTFMTELCPHNYPDVIYFDPMYPERKKMAKVKKEMKALQEIVGSDEDACAVFRKALNIAHRRLVVKRPAFAKFIDGRKPAFSIEGKNNRFDVYLNSSIQS